jgi:hypothetical protein
MASSQNHANTSKAVHPEVRIGARRLCFVLKDDIITVKIHVVRQSHSHIIDLTERRRTLLEFISAQPQAGATYTAVETGTNV